MSLLAPFKILLCFTILCNGYRNNCEKDGLTIYRTADGSGEAQRSRTCGYGSDMTVTMESNVAYVEYITDADNKYPGRTGFYATFNAEGLS